MDEKGIVLLDVRWIRGSNMDGKGDSYIKGSVRSKYS